MPNTVTPIPSATHHQPPSFLRGTRPLGQAFWGLYVGVHVVLLSVLLLLTPLLLAFIMVNFSTQEGAQPPTLSAILMVAIPFALLLAYFIFCFVAVWRCSEHHPDVATKWLARGVVIVHALWWAPRILVFTISSLGLDQLLESWLS